MAFEPLAVLLGLAAYGLASAAAALVVALIWRAWGRGAGLAGAPAARLLLALRLFPALAATLVVAALVVPAFLTHEPVGVQDEIGPGLVALALVGSVPLLVGLRRGLRGILATRARLAAWRGSAKPTVLSSSKLLAYRVHDAFPVVTVAGLHTPRLYVAEQVLEALTPDELAAVCAHEEAHVASQDNLKAFLQRCCPDWLGLSRLGRELEEAWLEASEQAADDAGVGADRGRALDLAAALVKAARLVPEGVRLDELPGAALHGGTLALRVERLVTGQARAFAPRPAWLALAASVGALLATAAVPGLQGQIYHLLEALVRITG